jgi:hypothetical protein
MTTVSDIFDTAGGPSQVARLLEVKVSAATEMKRRGSIPLKYWARLIDECRERGIRGINTDILVEAHSSHSKLSAAS